MQLPCVVQIAAISIFAKASFPLSAYAGLTRGNARLLMVHGTPVQKQVFATNELSGHRLRTICLSEPQADSSLSDVTTRAVADGETYDSDLLGPRYSRNGNKMWISGGDHEITENIAHLVLAKIPGPDGQLDPGIKRISLLSFRR